jgi:hypothetical protein
VACGTQSGLRIEKAPPKLKQTLIHGYLSFYGSANAARSTTTDRPSGLL